MEDPNIFKYRNNKSFFNFIKNNLNEDPLKLKLSSHGKESKDFLSFAIMQIECRKRFKEKLKNLIYYPEFIFPSVIAGEQATHEAVANLHASLVNKNEKWLDMTAGLGSDAFAICKKDAVVTACEIDSLKASALKYNSKILNLDSFNVINYDSTKFIKTVDEYFDAIFIDPARRDVNNHRIYNLHDCIPDITTLIPYIKDKTNRLIIKCSPMLDITQTIRDLPQCSSIKVVCVKGECKEILVLCHFKKEEIESYDSLNNGFKEQEEKLKLEAIDLYQDGRIKSEFSYIKKKYIQEKDVTQVINYLDESNEAFKCHYLYEPNAGIMKLAPWREIQKKYPSLMKLAPSTHLFINNDFIPNFPGRAFQINRILSKKDQIILKDYPANIISRNYPLNSDSLRKKLRTKEGSEQYIIASSLRNKKNILFLCSKKY